MPFNFALVRLGSVLLCRHSSSSVFLQLAPRGEGGLSEIRGSFTSSCTSSFTSFLRLYGLRQPIKMSVWSLGWLEEKSGSNKSNNPTKKVVSNMLKRMSIVFSDALAPREAGEVSSAEPLVGSNGLLTLSALEQAREKLTSSHKPHTCHRRYKCLCFI